jgi:hypothetical protein
LDTGSVSAPSLTFLGWTNSGIYNPDGNSVGFTVNGTQRGKFSTTGLAITGTLSASSTATFTTLVATAGLTLNTAPEFNLNNGTTNNRIYMNSGDANIYFRNITTSTSYIGVSANGIDLSGGQLKFPATQSASSDANTLDDYEEGTWTPSLGGTTTYTQQVGEYTKIGNLVYLRATLQISVLGTGSTTNIFGLPFTGTNKRAAGSCGFYSTTAVNVNQLTPVVNTSNISFVSSPAAGTGVTDAPAIFGNGTYIFITVTYQI